MGSLAQQRTTRKAGWSPENHIDPVLEQHADIDSLTSLKAHNLPQWKPGPVTGAQTPKHQQRKRTKSFWVCQEQNTVRLILAESLPVSPQCTYEDTKTRFTLPQDISIKWDPKPPFLSKQAFKQRSKLQKSQEKLNPTQWANWPKTFSQASLHYL